MKFCNQCGVQNNDEAVFCTQCGSLFIVAQQPQVDHQPRYFNQEATRDYVQQPNPIFTPQQQFSAQNPVHQYTNQNNHGKGNSIASLICGILSIISSITIIGGAVLGIIAMAQARVAKKKRRSATGGLITGIVGTILSTVMLLLVIFIPNDKKPELNNQTNNDTTGNYNMVLDSGKPISRTFMIYIVGSDLESENGAATMDIEEILESGVDLSSNKVIIMTGGAKEWKNDFISSDKTEIYEVAENGEIKLVKEMPTQNMAAPETLTAFLNYGYINYKTDAHSLILWNHGAGPMYGYGVDEISNDILSIPEFSKAFGDSPFGIDNKLEFIGFDACLMGSIEVAFALKDYAGYLIASQETEPGWGWNYTFLGEIKPTMTAEGIAVKIIDSYYNFCTQVFAARPDFTSDVSLSCLNLSTISGVEQGLNDLYTKAGNSLDKTSFPSAALTRSKVKSFGLTNKDYNYDLVDIQHLNRLMSKDFAEEADKLSTALTGVVAYNKTNIPNAGGVSIYYPYNNKDLLNKLALIYDTFDFADDYSGYIQKFIQLLQENPATDWNLSKAKSIQESKSKFSVQLTPEQVKVFASATFHVLIKCVDDDSDFSGNFLIFNSADVILDENGKLSANYEGKNQKIVDPNTGETFFVTMREQEITDTYVRYYIPAFFEKIDENDISSWEQIVANIQIQTDRDGQNLKLLSVLPFPNDTNPFVAGKETIDIYEFESAFIPISGREPIYNADGSLKPINEWEISGKYTGADFKLNPVTRDSLKFVQEEVDVNTESFMVFNIKDVYGNVFSSEIIPITIK